MVCCLCGKADVSGSGPIPEKSQAIQTIIACTNIKPFNPGNPPKSLPPAESLPEKSTTDEISAATHHF